MEANNISVSFKDRLLFNIPYFSLHSQEKIYLSGKNGAGKTTLLKIMAGILTPTQGYINLPKPSLLQRLAGFKGQTNTLYMHQSPYLFDTNVENNILYGLKNKKLSQSDKKQRLIKVLNLIELNTVRHKHVSLLSGGEKQKVALARAWICYPSVLLMDESSANLDTQSIEIEKKIIEDLIEQQGTSLVITSHHKNALISSCTQEWIIDNQRLIQKPQLLY